MHDNITKIPSWFVVTLSRYTTEAMALKIFPGTNIHIVKVGTFKQFEIVVIDKQLYM